MLGLGLSGLYITAVRSDPLVLKLNPILTVGVVMALATVVAGGLSAFASRFQVSRKHGVVLMAAYALFLGTVCLVEFTELDGIPTLNEIF